MSLMVVGGGLVGSLHALMLARLGNEVKLFDLRMDPREGEEEGKSINLALSVRGRKALRFVECEAEVLANSVPMRGRYIHNKDGSHFTLPYSPTGDCIYSVNRKQLNELLLVKAEEAGVKVYFRHKCVSVNFTQNTAVFEMLDELDSSNNPSTLRVKYDFIFGCDGAHSVVRKEMISSIDLFSQEYIQHDYKELEIPARDGDFALDQNYLHIWPRNEHMLIALANPDKSFTLTLFLPRSIFSELISNQTVKDFFATNFPLAVDLIGVRKLTDDFFLNPTGRLLTIKCNPCHYKNGLLMGDAAHAMVPFYGQGMNAGFEDCTIFQTILQSNDKDFKLAMTQYSRERTADSQAICNLSLDNYIEMRCRVNSKYFRFRRLLSFMLAKVIPYPIFQPRYPTVAFTATPYSEIVEMNKKHEKAITLVTVLTIIPPAIIVAALIYLIQSRVRFRVAEAVPPPTSIITILEGPTRYVWSWVPSQIQRDLGNAALGVWGYISKN